jgi:hypothetical protein
MSQDNWTDLGHGVRIARVNFEGQFAGIQWRHPRPDNGQDCRGGFVAFRGRYMDNHGWTLESEDPLTLSPSLMCRGCGCHGFIKNGAWVQC